MSRWLVVVLVMLAAGVAGSLPLRQSLPARDTSTEILVRLAEDGRVSVFVGDDSQSLSEVPLDAARFGDGNAATTRDTIAAMQPVLIDLAGSIEREENDSSRMRIRIEAAPRARIIWLMWVLQMGADPRTSISEYVLSTRGRNESLSWVLPSDGWLFVDEVVHRRPLYPDMYVSLELPASARASRLTLRVERLRREEPTGPSPFGPRGANRAPPPFAPVDLECRLDDHGTPGPLEPLVAAVRRLRELEREPEILWLRVTYPGREAAGRLPARTVLDVFGALQGIEGILVQLGSDADRRMDRRVGR